MATSTNCKPDPLEASTVIQRLLQFPGPRAEAEGVFLAQSRTFRRTKVIPSQIVAATKRCLEELKLSGQVRIDREVVLGDGVLGFPTSVRVWASSRDFETTRFWSALEARLGIGAVDLSRGIELDVSRVESALPTSEHEGAAPGAHARPGVSGVGESPAPVVFTLQGESRELRRVVVDACIPVRVARLRGKELPPLMVSDPSIWGVIRPGENVGALARQAAETGVEAYRLSEYWIEDEGG